MARAMSQGTVLGMAHAYFPSFLSQRERVEVLDTWHRGEQDRDTGHFGNDRLQNLGSVYQPEEVNLEYTDLQRRSPTPWLAVVVRSLVQNAELQGVRRKGSNEMMKAWESWQRNRMDGKQRALYTASTAHGLAFGSVMPGTDPLTGAKMTKMDIISAKDMAAFYDDEDDEWPVVAIKGVPHFNEFGVQRGWLVQLIDEERVYFLSCKYDGEKLEHWSYIDDREHGAKVTPIVRYAPNLDIDKRANSVIEPLIPMAARIDQDTFDRLIVQRFGAWKIRYIAGLAKPKTDQEAAALKMRLRVETLLTAEDADTKFGTLDASDITQFIAAKDADLRDLSATSQTPPHHLLGLSANMQAESLAAAEAGLQRHSREHRISWGESHEQMFRLDAHLRGDTKEMQAFDMEVRWRDTESRSLEQAAMALGMLATNLKVPVEMLWERIPGWSDGDLDRAKSLIESEGIDTMLAKIEAIANGGGGQDQPPAKKEPASASVGG